MTHVQTPTVPMIEVPADLEAEQVLRDARRLFQRTLASWASDLLVLRQRGHDVASWTGADETPDNARAA